MNRSPLLASAAVLTLLLSGCLLGPKYERPPVQTPPTYRDAPPRTDDVATGAKSIGDLHWSEIFMDAKLVDLIREALTENSDLRIAAERVLEQQAQVGITRAKSLPSVSAGGAYDAIGVPRDSLGTTTDEFNGGGFLAAAAWNLDFWGLYRRQSEAQRALLVETEWGQRATLTSVVLGVATSYIELRTLDAKLELTQETLAARHESLRLVSLRESLGSATMSDVRQSEELLYTAETINPQIESDIRQHENAISILLGRAPGPVLRNRQALQQSDPGDIPVGIPSALLERRPDVRKSEAQLIAANANIGVARAQFFPQITITGFGGTASNELSHVFNSESSFWFGNVSVSQALFQGGRLRNNLRLAEAKHREMVVSYRQTILSAFRDVSNALVVHQKTREKRLAQEKETNSVFQAGQLAHARYDGGGTSYLEVLTIDSKLFSAQLDLASARQQEALSLVELYRALGGGWQ